MSITLRKKLPIRAETDAVKPIPEKLLTIKEAAAFAVVSAITVRRWLKAGFLHAYRAGHQIRIDKAELVKFLSQ